MISPEVKQWCNRARALTRKLRWIQNKITEMSDEYAYMRDEYYYYGDDDKQRIDQCYGSMFKARNTLSTSNIMSGGTRRTRHRRRRS
jgi:hypothetical protein